MIDQPEQQNSAPQDPGAEQDNPLNDLGDNFDVQENPDGSASIIPEESDQPNDGEDGDFYENLAAKLPDNEKEDLARDYLELISTDKEARKKRDEQYADAIQRSGLGDDAPGGADFQGASKVVHPMIAEAAVDFSARAIKELFPADGPVKTHIVGKVTPDKLKKADRKKRHMNWQLTTQMSEFRSSLEQILTQTPMGGTQYSKLYWFSRGKRPKFEFIALDDIFIPFHAANFYSAGRKTHRQKLTELEFNDRVSSGLYLDIEEIKIDEETDETAVTKEQEISASERASDKVEGKDSEDAYDEDNLRTVYEVYCNLSIDDSMVDAEYDNAPYIMTIDEATEKVLAIYRNWDPEDKTQMALDWIVEWPFIPWRGAYAIGLSHLVGGLSAAATGALRALMDSAHINNAPTAIKMKGAKMGGQSDSINITEVHELDAIGDDIRKLIMPLPFNQPSQVLFELLGFLVTTAKGIVKTALDANSDSNPNTPVGTEMSRVEQGLVVYSAIHARMHESMRRTLNILHRLNSMYLDDKPQPLTQQQEQMHKTDEDDEVSTPLAYKGDYEGVMDIQPVSDPNIFSELQRFSQLNTAIAFSKEAPQLFNVRALYKRALQMMKFPGIDEIMPEPPAPVDENPATENIKLAMGQPAVALADQDHLAHLQVLCDFYKNPMFGQNPALVGRFTPGFVQHALQHMLFLYGNEIKTLIEKASGMPIKVLIGDEPEVKEMMSKAVAASSPLALQQTDALLEQVMPLLQQGWQYMQSNKPPTPMDPTQVAAQKVQQDGQVAQAKIAADTQKSQSQNQTEIAKEQMQIESEQKIEATKAQTSLMETTADNQTAMDISSMRAVTGHGTGGLKDGATLGASKSFSDGGLVTGNDND